MHWRDGQLSSKKRNELVEYSNLINCINLKIVPLYNFFLAKKQVDIETTKELVHDCYDYLINNYHMRVNRIAFILPKSEVSKHIDYVDFLLSGLYVKIVETESLSKKHDYFLISDEIWLNHFSGLRDILMDQDKEILLCNKLTDAQKKLNKLCGVRFQYNHRLDLN